MAVVGLLLCAAACLAGEVAKPRLVRTPKQRPARVRITPAGDADAAPPAANASQDDDARRRLRDRITNPPTSVPTITYSGVLEAPLILPPSGAVDAAVGITFLHELGPGVRLDEEYRDSAIVTRTHEVQMGTYDYDRSGYTGRVGMAFLVPYYRGQNYIDTTVDYAPAPSGHSAKLPSVDLNTSTYKSVRIHGVETDFAEYYTYDYKGEAADVVYKGKFVPATLQYQRGTGAYDGQVRLHDMAAYANDTMLRGFFHGFVQEHARRNSTERKAISMHYHRRFLVSEDELAVAVAKFGCSPSDRRDPVHMTKNTSRLSVETYGFLAPYFDGVSYSGKAASSCGSLANFTSGDLTTAVDVLDLTEIDPDLRGFAGGAVIGRYGLLVPYKNRPGDRGFFGKLVRVDLETFEVEQVLDLTRIEINSETTEIAGDALRGFIGGINFGKYLVLVIDLSRVARLQIPSEPDNELRGFVFGFAMGEYAYLVPHFSRDFYGKIVRVDMRDFDNLADLQAADESTEVEVGTPGAYSGVQYVDLERSDRELVGFSGGFAVRSAEPLFSRELQTPEARDIVRGCLGWEDVCDDQPVSHECDCDLVKDLPADWTLEMDSGPPPPRRASRR
ncbi:hypothetical protein JL720_3088 [Aureococcus anophagefferens]|nr:hypothetical protein JL720_3088 [Aureococcus anophagefferens]